MPVWADSQAAVSHCAYCDGPIRSEPLWGHSRDSGQRLVYCCYGCRLLGEGGAKPGPWLSESVSSWFKIAVGALIAGQAMLLGLAINLNPPSGPTRWLLHLALLLSSLVVCGILGRPLAQSVGTSIRGRAITIDLLFLMGVLGAFVASMHSTITGHGAVYYEVVAVLLTVYATGKTLGAQSRARAFAESRRLQDTFDSCNRLGNQDTTETVKAATIQRGDRVLVRAGDPIPVDGRIIQGQAFVRETPLTGEPYPVVRREGDLVLAGSYSEDGPLVVEASVAGAHRQLDGLLNTLAEARDVPSPAQSQADRIVRWFLPLVTTIAAGTFVYWIFHEGFSAGLFNSMAVLLVACPCAMGLATPLALWNAIAVLASRGLVVRNGH
jgi:cation transport ATPase